MIELPTAPTPKLLNSPKTFLIYGPPKCGKTTILSQLKDCLILDFEDGTDYVEALKLKINSLAELKETVALIKAMNPCPYKYIAVDTIDVLEHLCEPYATKLYKASTAGKNFSEKSVLNLGGGFGYRWLRIAFHEQLELLKSLGLRLIFISHLRDKFIGDKESVGVAAKDLSLTGQIREIMCAYCSSIAYITRDKDNNIVFDFRTTDKINCGSRAEHLKGQLVTFTNPQQDWKKIYVD